MSTFRLEPNGFIYLYHWGKSKNPFKTTTGLKIEPNKWNGEKMRPKSPNYTYKGRNVTKELIKMESAFLDAWNYFQTEGGFSPIKLRQKFKDNLSAEPGVTTSNGRPRFLDYFSQILEEYKATKSKNSWKGYNTSLNHLKEFFGRDIPTFEDIDMTFYTKYNRYLVGLGLSINSISTNWKYIKAVMKLSHLHKFHANTDYLMFKRYHEEADTAYLNVDELQKIFDLELTGYLDKTRDYFLIGAYTGLRFADWDQVSKSKIVDGQAIIRNSKTGEKSVIPISNNVFRILSKYKDGVLPEKISNQKMNDYVKLVAEKAGIDNPVEVSITKGGKRVTETKFKYELVTTHTARRSFATNMVLNGVPPHIIMMVTAHKSLSSFEKYVRFDEIHASIQLKESPGFQNAFGDALTYNEKMQHDPEFRKEQVKLLL